MLIRPPPRNTTGMLHDGLELDGAAGVYSRRASHWLLSTNGPRSVFFSPWSMSLERRGRDGSGPENDGRHRIDRCTSHASSSPLMHSRTLRYYLIPTEWEEVQLCLFVCTCRPSYRNAGLTPSSRPLTSASLMTKLHALPSRVVRRSSERLFF